MVGVNSWTYVLSVSTASSLQTNARPVCTESAAAGIYLFHRPSKISFLPVPHALPALIVYTLTGAPALCRHSEGSCERFVVGGFFLLGGWVICPLFVVVVILFRR